MNMLDSIISKWVEKSPWTLAVALFFAPLTLGLFLAWLSETILGVL